MWFLDQIVSYLASAQDWFYEAWWEVSGWVSPFNLLSTPLYWIYVAFYYLTYYFGDFNTWVEDIAYKITLIPGFDLVYSWFSTYFDAAINAWNWVLNAGATITNIIIGWWSSASLTVQYWIDSASQWLQSQIDFVNSSLTNLWTAWDSFKGKIPSLDEIIAWFSDWWAQILSPLTTWWNERLIEVNTLVDDTLRSWFPFYDTLVALWDKMVAFFVSPLDWLLDQFTDWFLGSE